MNDKLVFMSQFLVLLMCQSCNGSTSLLPSTETKKQNDFNKGVTYHFLVPFLIIEGSIFKLGFTPNKVAKPLPCMSYKKKKYKKIKTFRTSV